MTALLQESAAAAIRSVEERARATKPAKAARWTSLRPSIVQPTKIAAAVRNGDLFADGRETEHETYPAGRSSSSVL